MSYPSSKLHNRGCCNVCRYYSMIDSGYGWCTRNPPQFTLVPKKFLLFFTRFVPGFEYPQVPWCLKSCGDFKANEQKQSDLRAVEPN